MKENDRYYLQLAYGQADWYSKDPSTQNGAVLVNDQGQSVGMGANAFPRRVECTPYRMSPVNKYDYVIHAEVNAILGAARMGYKTQGGTLYCPWFACPNCAGAIINAGITRVVGHSWMREFAAKVNPKWTAPVARGLQMLTEAGVEYEWFDGPILTRGAKFLVGGKLFDPYTAPEPAPVVVGA